MPKIASERTKVTLYLQPEILKAMKHEGVERRLSLGELVEEAMASRMRLISHEAKP